MNRPVLVALVFCTSLALLPANPEARRASLGGSAQIVTLTHRGYTRTALVMVPSGYSNSTTVPLVLSFHGRSGDGKAQAWLTGLHDVGERNTFIVAYPDGIEGVWSTTSASDTGTADDVGYVDALIAKLSTQFNIDPDRVYASGMSLGGFFTHRLGCERSSRFAAIATVAGEMAPGLERVCAPTTPLAVLSFHGTADPIAPYGGGLALSGGFSLSAEQTAAAWGRLNQASGQTVETFRQGAVVCRTYQDGRAPVTLCSIELGGHTWPGGNEYAPESLVGPTNRDVSASEMLWQFFAAHPRTMEKKGLAAPTNLRVVSGG